MRMLDLFSGIGGFSYAAQQVWCDDLEIMAFCEIDKFCQKVLNKHWPDVPIIEDIRSLDEETFTDSTGNGLEIGGMAQQKSPRFSDGHCKISKARIDLLTGGFPCQPFSVAGKRKGNADERALWPEMLRVIKIFRPRWIIGENVAGFVNMGLDDSCADLEAEGYEVQPFVIPACAVNAPHRRDRVWIVATLNTNDEGLQGEQQHGTSKDGQPRKSISKLGQDVADTTGDGCTEGAVIRREIPKESWRAEPDFGIESSGIKEWWAVEPDVGNLVNGLSRQLARFDREPDIPRVAKGIPDRVNKLKALGNAVVPQIPMIIMQAIKLIDNGNATR